MRHSTYARLVVAAIAAAAALSAVPSATQAASWGVLGSRHTLTSQNLSFSVGAPISGGTVCGQVTLEADVRSARVVTVTSASFTGCVGTGSYAGCTGTVAATALPWSVTGITTSNITIDGFNLDWLWEGATGCSQNGQKIQSTGTLSGGVWSGASHHVTFTGATGTTDHFAGLGSFPETVTGTLRDDQQTLTLG
ncbi:MAG: hypothetical protein JWQ18_1013 [Conexibacter sp.]|nr:hypothetical protein [Conexibacter sp.]